MSLRFLSMVDNKLQECDQITEIKFPLVDIGVLMD